MNPASAPRSPPSPRRLDADPLPARGLGRPAAALGLRRRGRRDRVHRVHLEARPAGHRPADRPPGPRPQPEGRPGPGRAVPRLALPRRVHRLARSSCSRPRTSTAATPSSSRSSPTCKTGRSPTSHPGVSPRTPPGWSSPRSAYNLLRAAGTLACPAHAKARAATLAPRPVTVPARHRPPRPRRLVLHLPEGWHREQAWLNLWTPPAGRPPARPDQPRPGPHPHARKAHRPDPGPEPRTRRRTVSGRPNTPENASWRREAG